MQDKIFLVAKREYLTRVRKKSFIVMTIAAPLLMVLFYAVIIYVSVNRNIGDTLKQIYVCDESGQFAEKFTNSTFVTFTKGTFMPKEKQLDFLDSSGYFAILHIPAFSDSIQKEASLIYKEQPGLGTVSFIEDQMNRQLREKELIRFGIDQSVMDRINKSKIAFNTIKATEEGLKSGNAGIATAIGYILAIAIYMFIFLYGVQVMQGVIEEKTNRIVEVIISSVKPFQLMMGKIIGIALVGLTQFLIWILLITILGGGISGLLASQFSLPESAASGGEIGDIMSSLANFNYALIFSLFIFYFISGYLFYGALFAAIGSAVDNETDKQQFMLPVSLPLVFALVLSQSVIITNPNSSFSFWLSVVPFTSPIAMMVRIPFGVPVWELIVSMVAMVAGFFGTVWLAGRIYRVGILMYGKKPTYKEIGKWIFHKY